MQRFFALLCGALLALPACNAGQLPHPDPDPDTAGTLEAFDLSMPELGDRVRTIRVYLPPGYAAGTGRYPVLYMQDGQRVFSRDASDGWQVERALDLLVAGGGTRGMIVVGIDHDPNHRWDEYSPWVNTAMRRWVIPSWAAETEGGQGDAYVDFLVNTLKPMIDGRYRTLPGPDHTGIGGASMGGLISLYAGLRQPDVFGRVMAMSPAVWFAEEGGPWLGGNRMVAYAGAHAPRAGVRFYVHMGTAERSRDTDPDVVDRQGRGVTYPQAYLEGAQATVDALAQGGVPAGNLRFVVARGAEHSESTWATRFSEAALWLFERDR